MGRQQGNPAAVGDGVAEWLGPNLAVVDLFSSQEAKSLLDSESCLGVVCTDIECPYNVFCEATIDVARDSPDYG